MDAWLPLLVQFPAMPYGHVHTHWGCTLRISIFESYEGLFFETQMSNIVKSSSAFFGRRTRVSKVFTVFYIQDISHPYRHIACLGSDRAAFIFIICLENKFHFSGHC